MTSALRQHTGQLEDSLGDHPPRIQAVCLDVDDTLIDFTTSARRALFGIIAREDAWPAWQCVPGEHPLSIIGRDDLWPTWQRMTDEHVAKVIAGEMDAETMRQARTKAFFADLGALLDDDMVCAMERRRLEMMNGAWALFDDVLPCLDWLRAAGLKVAAVTNASGDHQRTKLNHLGIARFFDTVVIAGELGSAKPDPVIFHTACTQLDVAAAEALHVGDRLDVDAHGAQHAGLHGVWLDRDGADASVEPGVHVIESLADLPELLVSEFLTPCVTGLSGVPGQRVPDPVSSHR